MIRESLPDAVFSLKFYLSLFTSLSDLKILHSGLKDLHILFAVNIYSYCLAPSLGMSHLTEDTAIRAGDTLDCAV